MKEQPHCARSPLQGGVRAAPDGARPACLLGGTPKEVMAQALTGPEFLNPGGEAGAALGVATGTFSFFSLGRLLSLSPSPLSFLELSCFSLFSLFSFFFCFFFIGLFSKPSS